MTNLNRRTNKRAKPTRDVPSDWESWLVVGLAGLGVVHVVALILLAAYRQHLWTTQTAQTVANIAALEKSVDELSIRVTRANADREYLEMMARRQGFVRADETVLIPNR